MKPGIKTTEFWVASISAVLGVFVVLGIITPEMQDVLVQAVIAITGAIMTVVPIISYIISRFFLKQNEQVIESETKILDEKPADQLHSGLHDKFRV